jgi:glutaredoxin
MKYAMLTKSNCRFCTAALGLLKSQGHDVDTYDVQDPTVGPIVESMLRTKTVPQIYDPEGNFIGGYTELKEHLGVS